MLSGIASVNNSIFEITTPDKMCGIDIFIADSKCRGKGLGKQIINQFIKEFLLSTFEWVIVDPSASNINTIRCYEKSGFKDTAYSEANEYMILIRSLR